jgi:hypothetical protein
VRTVLIVPLAKLGFKHNEVTILTDENDEGDENYEDDEIPWDIPTEENIVRHLCEMSFVFLNFVQREEMAELVYDAQPNDSFIFYCT